MGLGVIRGFYVSKFDCRVVVAAMPDVRDVSWV